MSSSRGRRLANMLCLENMHINILLPTNQLLVNNGFKLFISVKFLSYSIHEFCSLEEIMIYDDCQKPPLFYHIVYFKKSGKREKKPHGILVMD